MLKVCRDITQWKEIKNPIVTVGSFDGVHCAHRSIIDLLNQQALQEKGESVIVSFSPHPRMVLDPKDAFRKQFRLLTTEEEKEKLLSKSGLQNLLVIHFDLKFSAMSAQDFVQEILVKTLKVRRMVIGYNHLFGHEREGSFEQMRQWGKDYGFEVSKYPEYMIENEHVSSSHIRDFIHKGKMEAAKNLLGYDYFMHGCWHQAIFEPSSKFKLRPPSGDYLTKVKVRGRYYYAICRIVEEIHFPDLPFLQEGDRMKVVFIKEVDL